MTKPKPLREKKIELYYGYEDTIRFTGFDFEDVKSAVEFYKKYESKSLHFGDENIDLYQDFVKWWSDNFTGSSLSSYAEHLVEERFNRWLFDYCFRDVV